MADLPGGGETPGVATSDQWVDEARMGFPLAIKRTGGLRPVPGVLGVLASGAAIAAAFPHLPVGLRDIYLSSLDQLHSSSPADRLANEVRGNGD